MEFDNNIYDQIEAFISGKMSEDERHLFEAKIQSDKDLKKEVDLHRSLKIAMKDEEWNLTENSKENEEFNHIRDIRRSEEYVGIEASIKEVSDQYFENEIKSITSKTWMYYVGAAVAIVCIAFFISNYSNNPSTYNLYEKYSNWKELPSFTVQSENESILAKGEHLFLDAEYDKAIAIFSKAQRDISLKGQTPNPYVLSYLGASYLELNDHENAIRAFDQLLNSNTIDSSKAYWYKAMVYLKQGNKQRTSEQLQLILKSEQNFKYQKAKELLKKLALK